MPLHEILFIIGNMAILPFWAMMILAPGWAVSERVMRTWWPVVVLAALYTVAIITSIAGAGFDRLTLDLKGLAALLGNPVGAATAWLHLLAFDLLAGRWAYLDSRERHIPAWMTSPALALVLLVGPLGMLVYLGVRMWWGRRPE